MTYSSRSTETEFGSDRPHFAQVMKSSFLRWLTAIGDVIAYALNWRRVSWTIERLSALDDATLRDLGMDRSEIVPTAYRLAVEAWENRRQARRRS